MGKCASKEKPAAPAKPKAAAKPPKDRKNLNPKDYVFSKKIGEVLIKREGEIDGEQFNIEECRDCDIFLLDNLACGFVDECDNCRIYIGPVESSLMIRNCRNCDFVIACQQYRTRDCANCRFSLFCGTEPIIESSTNMQFACFDFNYFSLRQQMDRAGLRPWNNKWWMIYDFTRNDDRPNWGLFPQEDARKLLRPEVSDGAVSQEEQQLDRVVPVTLGSRPRPSEDRCFVVFLPDSEAYIEAFVVKADRSEEWVLARARTTALSEDRIKSLLQWAKEPKLAALCRGKEVTGVEVCGAGVFEKVQEALATTGLAAGSKQIRLVPKEETAVLTKAFFEAWKDEV